MYIIPLRIISEYILLEIYYQQKNFIPLQKSVNQELHSPYFLFIIDKHRLSLVKIRFIIHIMTSDSNSEYD